MNALRLINSCLTACLLIASVSVVYARCPEQHEAVGERLFSQGGAAYKVELCWNSHADANAAGGNLLVITYQGDKRAAEAHFPLDVEGQIQSIQFDRANYALSAKAPTFPILVESRLRGATFDQNSTDLWLISLDQGHLRKVLAQNVAWESWGTQCEPDCQDASKSKTLVIVAAQKSAKGMSDLKLRTRGSNTPYGQDESKAKRSDKTTRYVFNGESYTAQD